MPRAKDNRKAVGTEHCDQCGTLARFYQVQRGNRTGYLYRRCECGADQRTGAAVQSKWLQSMDRTAETMIPHPLEQVREPTPEPAKPEPEETPEPRTTSGGNPKTETNKVGMLGLLAMGAAVAAALLT